MPKADTKKSDDRQHVFSVAMTHDDMKMLKRLSEFEDMPSANMFRRWVRSEFEKRFPGEIKP
jgi:hypothetical protein